MALNFLTFRELSELIQTTTTAHLLPADLLSGAWVDFSRYSALLRVDQARLKQGFLDWLGFDAVRGKPVGFRHCAECARLQYHCSLFDLAIVDRCPWHGCRLENPCYGCVARLSVNDESRNGWSLTSRCHCGYDLQTLLARPQPNHIPPELATQIDSQCKQMVGWWETVKQKQRGAAGLLSSIIVTGSFDYVFDERRAIALGFVERIAPIPRAWRHPANSLAARTVVYRASREEMSDDEGQIKREFACVRRYVWKHFVRSHTGCLEAILRMPEAERQCLDAAYVCSVCVAWLAWLGPGALKRQRATGPRSRRSTVLGRIRPLCVRRDHSLPGFAELALFSFMRGWAAIEQKIEYANLNVFQANAREWPQEIPRIVIEAGPDGTVADAETVILRVDESVLDERARNRCLRRETCGNTMSNGNFYMNYLAFEWTRSPHDSSTWDPQRLFRIKDFSGSHSNSYLALYI